MRRSLKFRQCGATVAHLQCGKAVPREADRAISEGGIPIVLRRVIVVVCRSRPKIGVNDQVLMEIISMFVSVLRMQVQCRQQHCRPNQKRQNDTSPKMR